MDQTLIAALGQLVMPGSPARRDPYPMYAQLREAAAAFKTPFGTMVTRHEPVERLLRDPSLRTPRGYRDKNDPAGPARFDPDGVLTRHRKVWMLGLNGEPHTRIRSLIAKVFTPRAVRALAPRIAALVDGLLAPAIERGTMDVVPELAYPLPATVICELLGIPEADRDLNRGWAAAFAATIEPMSSPAQNAAAERAAIEWDVYIRALMEERRARPGDALLDAMLSVEDGGARLSDDEIAGNVSFLFTAGHETTTNLVSNGLLALIRHPGQLARWRAAPELGEAAVEELLRYDSPVQMTGRVSDVATEIEGVPVAAGTIVSLLLGSANRDPRRHERADELDLGRDAKPLSFGAGPHYCLGAALARAEAKAALGTLLARTSSIELAGDPEWLPQLGLRGLKHLPIALRPS